MKALHTNFLQGFKKFLIYFILLTLFIVILLYLVLTFTDAYTHFWNSFGNEGKGSNNFFIRFESLWVFLQSVSTILALFAFILAVRQYVEGKKRDWERFKVDVDPLVVPISIETFDIQNKDIANGFILLQVKSDDQKDASWYPKVHDLQPTQNQSVIRHPLFAIKNIRDGIASDVKVEMSNQTRLKNDLREYHFTPDKTLYEGTFYDVIDDVPIVIFTGKHMDKDTVDFTKNFAIKLSYRSPYTNEIIVHVYEADVVTEKCTIVKIHNNPYESKPEYIHSYVEGQKNVMISRILIFNKITETERDGIYFSRYIEH